MARILYFLQFYQTCNIKTEALGPALLRSSKSTSALPIDIRINFSIASLLFNAFRLVFQQKGRTDPKHKSNERAFATTDKIL